MIEIRRMSGFSGPVFITDLGIKLSEDSDWLDISQKCRLDEIEKSSDLRIAITNNVIEMRSDGMAPSWMLSCIATGVKIPIELLANENANELSYILEKLRNDSPPLMWLIVRLGLLAYEQFSKCRPNILAILAEKDELERTTNLPFSQSINITPKTIVGSEIKTSFSRMPIPNTFGYYIYMLERNLPYAQFINDIRWNWVKEVDPKLVLDYGSGCGFLTLFSPPHVIVDSYDIGTVWGKHRYPQTGIRHDEYDLIFFNDVLEHVDWINDGMSDEAINEIITRTEHVSVSIPIYDKDPALLTTWKHYKPGEHLTIFTQDGLDYFFESRGFKELKRGTPECPPREDIVSVLYKRK